MNDVVSTLNPNILSDILSVDGKISPHECALLYNAASEVKSGCIIEIGAYHGRSTVALALGSMNGHEVSVYSLDLHTDFQGMNGSVYSPKDRIVFFENILRTNTGEIIHVVNLGSEIVSKGWSKKVSLLWIDGDHRYNSVKNDFDCWSQYLCSGGLVAFHDSTDPSLGPWNLIGEILENNYYEEIYCCDYTRVLRKL